MRCEVTGGKVVGVEAIPTVSVCSKSLPVWVGVPGCVLLVALAAQVRIPLPGTDVPMTLQLTAVLLTGFMLTPPRALAAMLAYLALGVAGLPVFTPGSAGLFGPTGGYLVGFVVAVALVSNLKAGRSGGLIRLLSVGGAGICAVFAFGAMWRVGLSLLVDPGGGTVSTAIATGLLPFVPKAVTELLLTVALVRVLRGVRA